MTNSQLAAERGQVVAACRQLSGNGMVIGTAGNVSVRAGELIAVTASGVRLADITVDQITVTDLDGAVVEGRLAPTSELQLHLDIYRRLHTGAVVHTHAPMSTAIGCVLDELPVVHYQQLLLGGPTKVASFHPFGTPELAEAVSAALGGTNAALMANHGAVTHGQTLEQAVEYSLLLEWACTLYHDANALGRPRTLSDDQQAAVIETAVRLKYGQTQDISEEPR
jgi:L-fuculose-phosphate aldolase